MSINIFYRDAHLQGRVSGPLKVIHNLLRSLDDCEVEYAINEDKFDNTLFLHWDQPQIDAYQTLRNKDKLLVVHRSGHLNQSLIYLQNIKEFLYLHVGV